MSGGGQGQLVHKQTQLFNYILVLCVALKTLLIAVTTPAHTVELK